MGFIKVIKRLMTFKMKPRPYLLYQALGSVLVNAAITAATLWLAHLPDFVPFAGKAGIARDLVLTTFEIAALTVVFGTVFVRLDRHMGRVTNFASTPRLPRALNFVIRSVFLRSLLAGVLFTGGFGSLTLLVFSWLGIEGLAFWEYVRFKMLYGVGIGMIVTPINAYWVLAPKT